MMNPVIIKRIGKQRGLQFAACMVFSAILYSLFMTNQLVNGYDGLWWGHYYIASSWETSIGRWLWPSIDKLRFGLSIDPVTSLISLAMFSAGMVCLLETFKIKKAGTSALVCGLFLSSTTVCASLSYRYMSPTFGLAFFLSVAAAYAILEFSQPVWGVCVGAVCIALSAGLYQAYINCTCLIILGWLILALIRETEWKKLGRSAIKSIISFAAGGCLYVILMRIHFVKYGVEMSSYNGGDIISIWNTLVNFPKRIADLYKTFWLYFSAAGMKSNILQGSEIYRFIFGLLLIGLLWAVYKVGRNSVGRAVLCIALIALIPVACNMVLLITTEASLQVQMTGGLTLVIPILLCVNSETEMSYCEEPESRGGVRRRRNHRKESIHQRLQIAYRGLCVVTAIVVVYGGIMQTLFDQNAMNEGMTACKTMAMQIIDDLAENGYGSPEYTLCFIGRPGDNSTYMVTNAYRMANSYAQMGHWWTKADCTKRSWTGLLCDLLGYRINFCSEDVYNSLIQEEGVRNMPCFPNTEYIQERDGVVVVKVSNTY